MSNYKYVTFEHSELGTLQVLVTRSIEGEYGIREAFRVYYGGTDITRDLSDEDRLKLLNQVNEETSRE